MKAIKNLLFIFAFVVPSTGHSMIPGRPQNNPPIRSLVTPPPGSIKALSQEQVDILKSVDPITYSMRIPGYGRLIPLGETTQMLALRYYTDVDYEALKQTREILKNKRKEAEEHYNQNRTPENIGKISTIDLALNRIEDSNINIGVLESLLLSNDQPEIVLLKEILNPIATQLTQEFSERYNLDSTELLIIQNTWFNIRQAIAFEQEHAAQEIVPPKKKEYPPHIEFAASVLDAPKNIVRQGYWLAKDAPKNIAEPSMEAEKMYAESLGEGSGQMPRTYNFKRPQSIQGKQPAYKPAPKSAVKALEQEESFGIGYQ